MFGFNKQGAADNNWLTKPIERRHRGHLTPVPDLSALAKKIIDRSGVSNIEHDSTKGAYARARIEGTILHWVEDIGSEHLGRLAGKRAATGMRTLKERRDFTPQMLFDYLSMQGPVGIALHNKIVEQLNDEQFIADFADIVRNQH